MPPVSEFLHPLLYLGAKDEENMQGVLGCLNPVWFKPGPLSEDNGPLAGLKYGDVTEKQGRILVKRFPDVFAWPTGTAFTGPQAVSREEHDDLLSRMAALEALVDSLRSSKGGRPPKQVPDAVV